LFVTVPDSSGIPKMSGFRAHYLLCCSLPFVVY
jgi:hypothetical protein